MSVEVNDFGWNTAGVATKPIRTTISAGRCSVTVMVAQWPSGEWVFSTSYRGPTGGGNGLPNLRGDAYQTLDEATDIGLERAHTIARGRSESTNSCMSEGEHRDWAKLVARIEEVQLDRAENQMELPLWK